MKCDDEASDGCVIPSDIWKIPPTNMSKTFFLNPICSTFLHLFILGNSTYMGMFLISLKKQPLWKNMRHEFLIFS